MRHTLLNILLITIIAITACSTQESHEEEARVSLLNSPPPPSASSVARIEKDQRKLIKEGRVSFRTNNLEATHKKIVAAVSLHNGYISSDHESKTTNALNHVLTIRIPASEFDKLLEKISNGVDYFDYKEIEVRDVTEEFLDIQTRVKTKKELENRYLELIKQAKKVSEILEIEREAGLLRTEIESMEGKLNYLQNKVSFSTLSVTFYEPLETASQPGYLNEFKDGFGNGLKNMILFLVAIVNVWPFIVLFILALAGFKYWRKKAPKS